MPNQTLSLIVENRVSGTEQIERLNAAHGRLYETVDRSSRAIEEGARRTAGAAAAALHAAEAMIGLAGAYGTATVATATHAAAAERLVDVYRGVRLALSPTMFTAYTLAAGAAAEALIKLTNANARFNEQTAIQAGRASRDFQDQYALNLIQQRQKFDFGPAFAAFQKQSGGGLGNFGEALKRIGDIKDPIDRVNESIKVFGREVGEKILPELNERFATNQQRIEEWGIGIDKVGRENLQTFKDDFHNFFLGFSTDADAIVLLAKKVGLGLSEITADSYVWLKNNSREYSKQMTQGRSEHPDYFPGLFLEDFDADAALAGTRTMQGMPGALSTPAWRVTNQAYQSLRTPDGGFSMEKLYGGKDEARDAEKDALEARIKKNQEFFQHPADTPEFLAQKDLRAQQLAGDQARLKSINNEIQAQKDAADAAKKAADVIRELADSMRTVHQQAALQGLTGGTRALAEYQQNLDNLQNRFGAAFTPGLRQQVGAATFPKVLDAQTQDWLKARQQEGEQQAALSSQFSSYPWQVHSQFGGSQYILTELFKRSQDEISQQMATQREIDKVGLNAQRESRIRTAGRQQSLAEVNADPGYEGSVRATNQAYSIRLSLAKELAAIDIDTALREQDAGKQRIDLARAEADLVRQTAEAAIDRELKLAELQKRRVDKWRAVSVEFIGAAENHNLPSFFKQQGQRIQNQIVGNAAEAFFNSRSGKGLFSSLSLTNDPNSTLGKLLAGTPFGAKASDPVTKAAQDTADNTLATVDILAEIAKAQGISLPGGLPGGASTLAGLATIGGLPTGIASALATFGSDTNGITGSGPAASILKAIGAGGGGIGSIIRALSAPGAGGSPSTADLILNGGAGSSGGIRIPGAQADAFHFANGGSSLAAGMFNGTGGANFATSAIASAGTAYAGTMAAIHDFKQGGARGIISGVGDVAGTAAAFDPEPISKGILMGVALGSQLISSLFGDPKQIRQRDINRRLAADQFYAPVAIDATMGTNGSALSTDRYGNLQSLDASPYPQVQQPYADLRHGITVPGRTTSPIGGPSGINSGLTNVTIQAWDGVDVERVLNKHMGTLADTMGRAVLHGHGDGFKESMRQAGF